MSHCGFSEHFHSLLMILNTFLYVYETLANLLLGISGSRILAIFFHCILGFGVHVQNMQDCCIGTHMAV